MPDNSQSGRFLREDHCSQTWRFLLRAQRVLCGSTHELGFQGAHAFCTSCAKEWRFLSRWDGEKNLWEPQYQFSLRLRSLRDFVRRCRFQQISPNSHFKKGRVCTLLTRDGRVTLTDSKLIVTRKGRRVERPVNGRGEFDRLLRKWFGINLQNDSMRKG